jgi:hypothetical protein
MQSERLEFHAVTEPRIPSEHATLLVRSIEAHESRVAELRGLIRMAEQEAALHEAIIRLSRDDELMRLVSKHCNGGQIELLDGTEAVAATLPENATLKAPRADDTSGSLTAELTCGDWSVTVGWHPESGFYAAPDTRFITVHRVTVASIDVGRRAQARADESDAGNDTPRNVT